MEFLMLIKKFIIKPIFHLIFYVVLFKLDHFLTAKHSSALGRLISIHHSALSIYFMISYSPPEKWIFSVRKAHFCVAHQFSEEHRLERLSHI